MTPKPTCWKFTDKVTGEVRFAFAHTPLQALEACPFPPGAAEDVAHEINLKRASKLEEDRHITRLLGGVDPAALLGLVTENARGGAR